MKNMLRLVTVCLLGVALLFVGCSKNEACETDPAAIEDARAEVQTAQGQLDSANAELQSAEAQKSDVENKLNNLPDKGEMEEELYTLKKGSGR